MNEELITPENLSTELLKTIFEAAYMNVEIDEDGDLKVREECTVYVRPNKKLKDRISLLSMYGFKDSSTDVERFECANHINKRIIIVRAYATDKGNLYFEYDFLLEGGLTKKSLVLGIKRFASIPRVAVKEFGEGIID